MRTTVLKVSKIPPPPPSRERHSGTRILHSAVGAVSVNLADKFAGSFRSTSQDRDVRKVCTRERVFPQNGHAPSMPSLRASPGKSLRLDSLEGRTVSPRTPSKTCLGRLSGPLILQLFPVRYR